MNSPLVFDPGLCPACLVEFGAKGKFHHKWCIWCRTVKKQNRATWKDAVVQVVIGLLVLAVLKLVS